MLFLLEINKKYGNFVIILNVKLYVIFIINSYIFLHVLFV